MDNIDKFVKIKNDDFIKIIEKINPLIFIGYDEEPVELFSQIKVGNLYIPYIISSYGRIFSIYYKGSKRINVKQLKTNFSKRGYERLTLYYKGKTHSFQIHDLVALHFISKLNKNQNQVNHKDGIKRHNYVENLEWCTAKENSIHAEANDLRHHAYGEEHGRSRYTEDDIRKVCILLEMNEKTIREISDITSVGTKLIYRIYKKKAWLHVSKDYDIDNFNQINVVTDEYREQRAQQIHDVCKMIESNNYTLREISDITDVPYKLVNQILHKSKYKSITSLYDFSKFNNYKINKEGSTTIESV